MSTPTRPPRPVGSAPSAGLTAPGVVVIVFAASLFGLLVDVFTGNGVGWIFGIVFIAVSGYAAFQVRRRDVAAAIIAPPLVFAVLVVSNKMLSSAGPMLTKVVAGMNGLLDDGPMLWIGSALAVLIVGYRIWRERRPLPATTTASAPAPRDASPPPEPVPAQAPLPAALQDPGVVASPPARPTPIPMPSDPAS